MNRLNKLVTLILIFSFLFGGVVLATIEKDSTKKKTGDIKQNITPGDSINGAGPIPVDRAVKKRPRGYDDFVDKNGNGIDDRAEQKIDGRKKDISPGISDPNSSQRPKLNNNRIRLKRSPDDSVVKLKNR